MTGNADIQYTAVRGFDLSTVNSAVLAALADTTEETLGVDETTELVTNGVDPTATTGWTVGTNGSLSATGNRLRLTNTAGGVTSFYQSITTVVGQAYVVSVDYDTDAVTGNVFINIGNSAGSFAVFLDNLGSTTGTHTFIFIATATTTFLTMSHSSGALNTEYTEWNNLSIKATGNKIENHNFVDNTNSQWTLGTGWSISGGTLTHASGTGSAAYQSIVGVAGQAYVVTFTVSSRTAGNVQIYFGGTLGADVSANATYTYTVVMGSADSLFQFSCGSTFDGSIDDVSIRLAVPDLSANADGLEVHGQVTKSAVNTGAELVGYLATGFGDNYLRQPFNSGITLTTAFSVDFWVKSNTEIYSTQTIFQLGSASDPVEIHVGRATSSGNKYFTYLVKGATTATAVTNGYPSDTTVGLWYKVTLTYSAGSFKFYVGASLASSQTLDVGSLSTTVEYIDLMYGPRTVNGQEMALSLPKFYNVQLTANQIKTIYDNEKHLFDRYAAYTQIGQQYTLNHGLSAFDSTSNVDKHTQKGIGTGSPETLINDEWDSYNITTDIIPHTSMPQWREFLHSTNGSQIFNLKPGDHYEPNKYFPMYREDKRVKEEKTEVRNYKRLSFSARVFDP